LCHHDLAQPKIPISLHNHGAESTRERLGEKSGLGGFFLQCRFADKGPGGEGRSLELDGYDPVNKNFTSDAYGDDGGRFSGVLTITGNTWTYAGRWVSEGKQYQYKGTFVLAPDLASGTYKEEISVDGKTWTTYGESKWTKAQPAPKK
jgi:hypothetical protein